MTDREKLIELIRGTPDVKVWPDAGGKVADHLISNGVTVQKWIPVTERLPENDYEKSMIYRKEYLVRTFRGRTAVATFGFGKHPCWVSDHGYLISGKNIGSVTHWMPLPEPPKEINRELQL